MIEEVDHIFGLVCVCVFVRVCVGGWVVYRVYF